MISSVATSALLTAEHAAPTDRLAAADAAVARRSVRTFLDVPVTEEEVHQLLELTGRAPSAFNLQPWRFVVVRDAGLKADLQAAAYGQQQVSDAPVVIAMFADMDDTLANLGDIVHPDLTPEKRASTIAMLENTFGGMSAAEKATWANAQSNIALGYLLLIAKSEGFDTSPMLGFQADKVKALLDIPETATVTALVAIGRGADEGVPSYRHTVKRVATFR